NTLMVISQTGTVITINTIAQFIGRLVSSGTTFILTVLLARSLGADGYGDFSKIITYVSFFYLFADFGINAAFLQIKREDSRFSFSHLFATRIALTMFLVFLSISILNFLPHGESQGYTPLVRLGIILYSLSIGAHAFVTSLNAIFQEKLRYDLSATAVILGSIIRLAITISLGLGSVIGAIICFLVSSFATFGFGLIFAKNIEHNLAPIFSMKHSVKILIASLPLGLTLVFNVVYFRIDTVILTLTQSTIDVGIYNLAYNFFEVAIVLPVFFMNALYPVLLKRKEKSLNDFFSLSKKAAIALVIASGIVMSVVFFTAPVLSFIKPEFSPGIQALRILGLSLPFFYLTSLTMWMLVTLKKSKTLVYIYGVSVMGNIIANSIFVPKIGFMASAWITVVGEGVVLLLSSIVLLRYARQTTGIRRILTP
ncbi:MAG: oligosaccharide flippase family protein, partial [Patescibacteria group bacterium]|nr:oligosaccharide flippase family protein [Patescibacteria group bacterium]